MYSEIKDRVAASNVKVELTPFQDILQCTYTDFYETFSWSIRSDSVTFNFTIGATCPNNSVIYARLRVRQNDTITMYDKNVSIFVGNGYAILRDSAENGTSKLPDNDKLVNCNK